MPRKRKSRIYTREQGGVVRYYADFRDFADVGGKREALIPIGSDLATTDEVVAQSLMADRLAELQERRRNKTLLGVERQATLAEYVRQHLIDKRRAGKVAIGWIERAEVRLRAATEFFGADRDLASISVRDVQRWAGVLAERLGRRSERVSGQTIRHYLNALSHRRTSLSGAAHRKHLRAAGQKTTFGILAGCRSHVRLWPPDQRRMILTALHLQNYRCFEDVGDIPIHRLTVFIGENDAGKTALVSALDVLLTNKSISEEDYRKIDEDEAAEEVVVGAEFQIEPDDQVPPDYVAGDGRTFRLLRRFTREAAYYSIEDGSRFADQRWATFAAQNAAVQRELLTAADVDPGGNSAARVEQFRALEAAGRIPKERGEIRVAFSQLVDYLPRFERVASTEYRAPDSMVQRTFQTILDDFLYPQDPNTGERRLRAELEEVKARLGEALNEGVQRMEAALRQSMPQLARAQVDPVVDFTRILSTANLMIDYGEGLRLLASVGEGTKKKLWMGLLDWQRATERARQHRSIIRVYDEPDVNLDYAAERKLFGSILESTRRLEERTQAIVCTHSVTLIDRAPATSINLIRAGEDGSRSVEYITSHADDDVRGFLASMGTFVGLSNSSFFYERCFLVVEGESEEAAVPILYKNLFGRSLIEDGIVLINMFTCSAWKGILSVLLRHKVELTLVLLDQDCTLPGSSGRITEESLREVGFPADFCRTRCFYVGQREFEDAFQTADIAAVLNANWPKEDGSEWTAAEIDGFRGGRGKFSQDLLARVRRTCDRLRRNTVRKPEFAEALAVHCRTPERIPDALHLVFEAARETVGLGAAPRAGPI